MLIGIGGSAYSGKSTFANWLTKTHGFTQIKLKLEDARISTSCSSQTVLEMTLIELSEWILLENRWKDNFVVFPLTNSHQLFTLQKRPFFLFIALDASLPLRYSRYFRLSSNDQSPRSLAEFVEIFDCSHPYSHFHASSSSTTSMGNVSDSVETRNAIFSPQLFIPLRQADIVIQNNHETVSSFYTDLDKIYPLLNSSSRLRPSWDDYFSLLADLAAHRSNCMKRRVGCILVRNYRVIATGYNGTPRGCLNCNEGGCGRCNGGAKCAQDLSECLCLHAEENALLEAGRERISGNGSGNCDDKVTLYCNTCPCLSCAKKIVQCGIKEVVYRMEYGTDEMTFSLFKQVGIMLRQHRPLFNLHIVNGSLFTKEQHSLQLVQDHHSSQKYINGK